MKSLKMFAMIAALAFPMLSTYSYADNVDVPETADAAEAIFVLDEDSVEEVTDTEKSEIPSTVTVEIVAEEAEEGESVTVEPTPATTATVAETPAVADNSAIVEVEAAVEEPEEVLSEEMKRFREQARIVVQLQNEAFTPQFTQIATNKSAIEALEGRVRDVEKKLTEALEIKKMLGEVQVGIAGLNTSVPQLVRQTLDGKANEELAKSGLSLDSSETSIAAKPTTTTLSSQVSTNGGVKRVTAAELLKIAGNATVMWKEGNSYTNIYFQNGRLLNSYTHSPIDRNSVGELVSKKGNFDAPYEGQYQSMPTTSYGQSFASSNYDSYPQGSSYPSTTSYPQSAPMQVGGGCRTGNCR